METNYLLRPRIISKTSSTNEGTAFILAKTTLIADSPLNEGNLKRSSNTSLSKHKILKLGTGENFFFSFIRLSLIILISTFQIIKNYRVFQEKD